MTAMTREEILAVRQQSACDCEVCRERRSKFSDDQAVDDTDLETRDGQPDYEYRFSGSELRADTSTGTIHGLAIPYGKQAQVGPEKGGWREQVAPGACDESLANEDIRALWNHDTSKPLGRVSAGNLKLKSTDRGVHAELQPANTSYGNDVRELVKSGVVKGWSFGFRPQEDDWTDDNGKPSDMMHGTNRVIKKMKLHEVSPCTFPVYHDHSDIAARSELLALRGGQENPVNEDKRMAEARARMATTNTLMGLHARREATDRVMREHDERMAAIATAPAPAPVQRSAPAPAPAPEPKPRDRDTEAPRGLQPQSEQEEEARYQACRAWLAERGYELARIDTGIKMNANPNGWSPHVIEVSLMAYQIVLVASGNGLIYQGNLVGAEFFASQLATSEAEAEARRQPPAETITYGTVPGAWVCSAPYGTELPSMEEIFAQEREARLRERIKAELRAEAA